VKIGDCIVEHFKISEVADQLHVDTRTIKKACLDGEIEYFRLATS